MYLKMITYISTPLEIGHIICIFGARFQNGSPSYFVTGGSEGIIRKWDIDKYKLHSVFSKYPTDVSAMDFSEDGCNHNFS